MHLQKLRDLVAKENLMEPFCCIQDLVENGLSEDRFSQGSHKPTRDKITIFLASWCRLAGFEADDLRDWLTAYCVEVLSGISSSSASQIRHSTKSSINYVYRSQVPFECNCENNTFKAKCLSSCPVYDEMKNLYVRNLEAEQVKIEEYSKASRMVEEKEPDPETLPVTQRYKEQFEEAVALIRQYLDKGHMKKEIAVFLNEKGYKTITGNDWKAATVSQIAARNGWAPKRKMKSPKG